MSQENTTVTPISSSDRILSLDILRGTAVLGILIMNIQSYSMISAAYTNPSAFGDLTGLNRLVWILSHIFADQKFMTMFSILFGAGILLMTQKAEAKGKNAKGYHYRRSLWLLVIGIIHAYFLWYGDILVAYALCALFIYLFRNFSPKKLSTIGIIFIAVPSLLYLMFGLSMSTWPQEAVDNILKSWAPDSTLINKELATYRGTWSEQMNHRISSALFFQTFLFFIWSGWRAGGLMMIGMALFKWGVLTLNCPKTYYKKIAGFGFLFGLPLIGIGIIRNFAAEWSLAYSMFLGWQFNYWGSLFIAFAYIGIIALFLYTTIGQRLKSLLAAVGRMALSNYLLQTIICTTLFYGHGFGWFGRVDRFEQILIVFSIWVILLSISSIWLRYFLFGPAEWLWRTLTYWKIQPFRKNIGGSTYGILFHK